MMSRLSSKCEITPLPVCAVDIGGVLRDRRLDRPDTSRGSSATGSPAVPGALDAVRNLAELFEGRIFIISKAHSVARQEDLMQWLEGQGVLDVVAADHVTFVARAHHKNSECERVAATHAIDDLLEPVLKKLTGVRHRIWFLGGSPPPTSMRCPRSAVACQTWDQVVRHVETTLRRDWPGYLSPVGRR